MNIRIVSLCIALGLSGCNSTPVVSDAASATGQVQHKCVDLTQAQAQKLLEAGHTYLDPEKDGKTCIPEMAATGSAAKSTTTSAVVAPTAATVAVPYVPTGLSSSVGSAQKHTSDSSYHQYRCADLTDSQAQVLMEAGHTYLDADGDGDACEPDPRRDYAPVATKFSGGNCHWVEGYTRKNGTKVRGHTRCR